MQSLVRFGGLAVRTAWRPAAPRANAGRSWATCRRGLGTSVKSSEDFEDSMDDVEDTLAGKPSGDDLRRAFASRSAAAVRYDYFAQRAELEAELEAATTFRALKSVAEQQALGFLELLEEYGSPSDADSGMTVGSTLDNVASAALHEKRDADTFQRFAENAAGDDLEQLSEWMTDMSDASSRLSDRLELVSGLLDAEFEDMEGSQDAADDASGASPKVGA